MVFITKLHARLPGLVFHYAVSSTLAGDKFRVRGFIRLILTIQIEVKMEIDKNYVIITCSYFTFFALYITFTQVKLYE